MTEYFPNFESASHPAKIGIVQHVPTINSKSVLNLTNLDLHGLFNLYNYSIKNLTVHTCNDDRKSGTVNDDDGSGYDNTGSVKDGACNNGLILMMPVVVTAVLVMVLGLTNDW